jgi:hypothetical protein
MVEDCSKTKENVYLIWKFKPKRKMIGEIHIQQNIIIAEIKFTNRKKRHRKLNILANLFDIGRKFEDDTNLQEIIKKENLFAFIKLHKLKHNNNPYFDSIHFKSSNFIHN